MSIEICMVAYFAAWAGVSLSRSYISSSQSMYFAYKLLTKSKETYIYPLQSITGMYQIKAMFHGSLPTEEKTNI